MSEWSIVVVRLQTLLSSLEAAYEHVAVMHGSEEEEAECVMRAIWSARVEIKEAIPKARKLRDEAADAAERAVSNVK